MKPQKIVFWLVPAKPEVELFRGLIHILAKQLNAPLFEPHLTLGMATDLASAKKALRHLKARPIHLKLREVDFSPEFRKTLFMRLAPNAALEKLIADLTGAAMRRHDLHVSLLYKKMNDRAQRELASTLKLPFREVVFDTIRIVRCAAPTKTRADVENWRSLAVKKLAGDRSH